MDYGKRIDGSQKGKGFFGELKRPDGNVSTEISIGVGLNGKETQVPLIVPTLTKQELDYLLNTSVKSKTFFDKMPEAIIQKAVDHAKFRIDNGQSPFASQEEVMEPPK
jgi:hypothetical protein